MPSPTLSYRLPDDILTMGGDDRITMNTKGVNKYHCTPQPLPGVTPLQRTPPYFRPMHQLNIYLSLPQPVRKRTHIFALEFLRLRPNAKSAIFRGSCTCNIPTEGGYKAAEAAWNKIQSEEVSVGDIMEGVRSRLKSLYDVPAGTEVFLTPSGSDAEYIPLQIAKTLSRGRKIVNIVTCDSEVGSGTLDAAGGRYFSPVVPLPDEEMCVRPNNGVALEGLCDDVETFSIPAREMHNAGVVDAADPTQVVVDRCAQDGSVPIVHCVLGSKTGIYEPFPSTNFGKMVATRDAFIVVDACQGRFRKQWLQEYLQKGAMILITGSKFYRGPPFSGAVFVPGQIMERLVMTDVNMPAGLRYFFSSHEMPRSLTSWRSALKDEHNTGLALRWVAALEEMEPTLAIPDDERDRVTEVWRAHVVNEIGKHSDAIEAFEPKTRKSIVSIRLKKQGQEGQYLNNDESKKVFEWMTQDLSDILSEPAARLKCYIGQPVVIQKGAVVVRIALGSDSLRACLEDEERLLEADNWLLRKLALLVQRYDDIVALKAAK